MNSNISKNWLIILLIPILFVGYRYYTRVIPCAEPIEYKIGTIDPRFGVSQASFLKDIAQAGNIWSSAINKTLFQYNPKGPLTINLIYDNRQATTQKEQTLNSNIDANSQVASSVKDEYTSLTDNYNTAQATYTADLAKFDQANQTYESQVQYWNAQGGAPQNEYATLQQQKSDLTAEQASLETERQNVNALAGQINALIDKYNLIVSHINANVDAINNDGLSGSQFEEGLYVSDDQGPRIYIYQFDSQTAFIRVLAHEMGHSLGLQHDAGVNSIMNPVNTSQNLVLSSEDLQELKTECRL